MENERTEFIITVRETNDRWFTVEADTLEEAMQMIENYDVDSDGTTFVRENKPKVQEVRVWVNCPNRGQGWTEVSKDIEAGSRDWHYNGRCVGVMVEGNSIGTCYKCESARQNGHRLLTSDEIAYLKASYVECRHMVA
jgi:hypothetical protein